MKQPLTAEERRELKRILNKIPNLRVSTGMVRGDENYNYMIVHSGDIDVIEIKTTKVW